MVFSAGDWTDWQQSGTLFTFIFSRVVKRAALRPDCLGSNPDSATYKLVTYTDASEPQFSYL